MMKHYKTTNKQIIKRDSNGRFSKWTFSDFGLQASNGKHWCRNCHHGWFPLIEAGYCPECNCQEKLTLKECVELGFIKITEVKVTTGMINPFIFNKLASGAKYEAEIVDDNHIFIKEFDLKMYVVGGSFQDNFFEIPEDKKGFIYLRDRWFYFSNKK